MTPNPIRRRSMMHAITNIFHHDRHPPAPERSNSVGSVRTDSGSGDGDDGGRISLERTRSGGSSSKKKAERDAEISNPAQDLLFHYQLEQRDPRRLGPEAFHAAGIAANRAISARIHGVLQRHNIISTHAGDYKIYSDRITRQLPGQLPALGPQDLHRMVGMLFWWEQEQVRWNLIEAEIEKEKKDFEEQERAYLDGTAVASSSASLPPFTEADDNNDDSSPPPPPPPSSGLRSEVEGPSSGMQRMSSSYEQQARLERHKLAVAHLENSKRAMPSLRRRLSESRREQQRQQLLQQEGDDVLPHHQNSGTRPPAYGDSHNSVPVMGSPSREDVSIIFSRGISEMQTQAEPEQQQQQQQQQDSLSHRLPEKASAIAASS